MSKRPSHSKNDRLHTDNTSGYVASEDCPESADRIQGTIPGDPLHETYLLESLQGALYHVPGVVPVAKGLSLFGEHAAGWLAISALGAVVDSKRRQCWLGTAGLIVASHASSVIIKRIVRRPRPHAESLTIGVKTPSQLSFPSSHSTSSTTALLCLSALTGNKAWLLGIPAMMTSRMVVGVHYPSDVTAGALLGGLWALGVKRFTCPAAK